MLKDEFGKYYFDGNYNCAESLIRAANDYYQLGIEDRDMILFGGYGAGIQCGNTCGAMLAAVAVLSLRYIPAKAHESADITPVVNLFAERFQKKMGTGDLLCSRIKPLHFQEGFRCRATVAAACDLLEQVIADYDAQKAETL